VAYIICEPCIGTKDTACVDVCPVDCIHPTKNDPDFESSEMLYIHPTECIDCGACEPACPTKAIFEVSELPEKWNEYVQLNADLSKTWPNISAKKDALPEAEQWKDVAEKRQHLEGV
jgi:ferredoxin